MRILYVLEHFHPYIGGAERLFLNLAKHMVKEGHLVTVVTTRFDRLLPAKENFEGIEIIRLKVRNRFLFTFLSFPEITKQARRADLIHTTTYNAALPAYVGARLAGIKCIITFHEVWGKLWFRLPFGNTLGRLPYYLFEQLLIRLPFNKFVAPSKATTDRLRDAGISAGKIACVYNGIDYNKLDGHPWMPPRQFTLTYYGRVGISKGFDMLIPAAGNWLHAHPDHKLKLILSRKGDPGLYRKISRLIKQYIPPDNLVLLHDLPEDELFWEVASSSCVLIPSYSEGFSFVAAECAAMGVPVIHSGRGALRETAGKGIEMQALTEQGILEAVNLLYQSGPTTGQEHGSNYSLQRMVVDYAAQYEAIKKPPHGDGF